MTRAGGDRQCHLPRGVSKAGACARCRDSLMEAWVVGGEEVLLRLWPWLREHRDCRGAGSSCPVRTPPPPGRHWSVCHSPFVASPCRAEAARPCDSERQGMRSWAYSGSSSWPLSPGTEP